MISFKQQWQDNGFFIVENLISEELIEAYSKLWIENHGEIVDGKLSLVNPNGWEGYHTYLEHVSILQIFCGSDIPKIIEEAIGTPAGLHLNFTGWVSTRKTWHQDVTYGDKTHADNYIGVWVALEDIDYRSGPFQLIPKSHKWDLDFKKLYPNPQSERASEYFAEKFLEESPPSVTFIAKKGDVIFWHGHAVHRGDLPIDESITRKSIIGHFGSIKVGMLAQQEFLPYKHGHYFNFLPKALLHRWQDVQHNTI